MIEDELEKQHSKGIRQRCFRYFISELVRIAEIVEKPSSRRSSADRDRGKKNTDKNRSDGKPQKAGDSFKPKGKRSERPIPLCLYGECKSKGTHHLLQDYSHVKDNSKQKLKLIEE
eukprot:gb/GEZJ01005108.1/.p2 GENE.gb/GEZJ01005108.1/~~gb/GEZJ01005108.1/.p2  ORF type:complete len:116 (+),score=16.88 gb/GEZJ01005108.1/:845-1192(+)